MPQVSLPPVFCYSAITRACRPSTSIGCDAASPNAGSDRTPQSRSLGLTPRGIHAAARRDTALSARREPPGACRARARSNSSALVGSAAAVEHRVVAAIAAAVVVMIAASFTGAFGGVVVEGMQAGELAAQLDFFGFEFGGVWGGGLFGLSKGGDVSEQPVRLVYLGSGGADGWPPTPDGRWGRSSRSRPVLRCCAGPGRAPRRSASLAHREREARQGQRVLRRGCALLTPIATAGLPAVAQAAATSSSSSTSPRRPQPGSQRVGRCQRLGMRADA